MGLPPDAMRRGHGAHAAGSASVAGHRGTEEVTARWLLCAAPTCGRLMQRPAPERAWRDSGSFSCIRRRPGRWPS